ncbi:MAG TPA: hypothetical protein VFT87_06000 [Candidatus Saccharimonadales bacterium]|nr:hypothetical protein [Candidatus Saccharimonadales bacterium]
MTANMSFDDIFATGAHELFKGDRVNIVTKTGGFVAGPLTVALALCYIGDWIHLVDADGETYLEGNLTAKGGQPADISHLPEGWRFEKLEPNK